MIVVVWSTIEGMAGANVDRLGRTPLHYAAMANDATRVEALLADGVNPNRADHLGFTALHFTAQEGAFEACTALLDARADVEPGDSYGNTPCSWPSSTVEAAVTSSTSCESAVPIRCGLTTPGRPLSVWPA
jgi:ankyrin repeat protein